MRCVSKWLKTRGSGIAPWHGSNDAANDVRLRTRTQLHTSVTETYCNMLYNRRAFTRSDHNSETLNYGSWFHTKNTHNSQQLLKSQQNSFA